MAQAHHYNDPLEYESLLEKIRARTPEQEAALFDPAPRPVGRPPMLVEDRMVPFTVMLTPTQRRWINDCPGAGGQAIRDLIDYAMRYLPEPSKGE